MYEHLLRLPRRGAAAIAVGAFAVLLCSCGPGARPPSPSGPRSSDGPDSYFVALAACLREAGWDAVLDPSGQGVSVDSVTGEQRPAFMRARAACTESVGEPPTVAPLTEAEIRDRYAYLLAARDCLLALGYPVSEPPSEDVFVDSWSTGPWSPYADIVDALTPDEWDEANRECPQG